MRKNKNRLMILFGIILIFTIFISSFSPLNVSSKNNGDTVINDVDINQNNKNLNTQGFTEDDYTSILKEELSSLGNITVLNASYHNEGYFKKGDYPHLNEDYESYALNSTYYNTTFIESIEHASVNYLKKEYFENDDMYVKLNDSVVFEYNNTLAGGIGGLKGFIVYHPKLVVEEVLEIYINNTKIDEDQYSILSYNFLYFNYYEYNDNRNNDTFTLDFIYSHKIEVKNWEISQNDIDDLIAYNSNSNLEADYNYFFEIRSDQYKGANLGSSTENSNLTVSLNVSLYERGNLVNFNLALNDQEVDDIVNYVDMNNNIIIPLSDNFTCDNHEFSLNFTSNFEIEFLETVGGSWAIDRLIASRDIRERIYFPSVISGPEHLLIKFSFYESSIYIEQFKDCYSLFDREVDVIEANKSDDESIPRGLKIKTPSLIIGENACPFMIKYQTNKTVRIIITDNINMPVWDLDVDLYYYSASYGTYVSKNITQPVAPLIANENGEIVLRNIPLGEYTFRIYREGSFIKEKTIHITTLEPEIFYIHTNIPHFPSIILVFSLMSALLFFVGFIAYVKNKKKK